MSYRKDFAWGCATSSYQIEGAYNADGKGPDIWDVFSHSPGRTKNGDTGDVACDHYHRMKEDVAMMASLGLNSYRFSVNWARVLPEGRGFVNEAGIRFYDELIDELLKNDITPFLTLYHWEMPYEIYKRGGWMNPDTVEWFGDYAALIADRFSDRVKNIFTLNEPQCFVGLGYVSGEHAPGLKTTLQDSLCIFHNVLKSHGRAVQRLREKARQPLMIGIAPTGSMCYPASDDPKDIEAARKALFAIPEDPDRWTWNVSAWSDPVFFGQYPKEFLQEFEAYMPRISEADMKLISEPVDIYGQNIYNGHMIRMGEDGSPAYVDRPADFPQTANGWPITPECLYWGPRFLYERYKTPLYITENGTCCNDTLSPDGAVHDTDRIDFLSQYLEQLEKATEVADLRGYFLWSLMDNFEWNRGYSDRFGMIYVDFDNLRRIPKDSAYWYRDYIKSHK